MSVRWQPNSKQRLTNHSEKHTPQEGLPLTPPPKHKLEEFLSLSYLFLSLGSFDDLLFNLVSFLDEPVYIIE